MKRAVEDLLRVPDGVRSYAAEAAVRMPFSSETIIGLWVRAQHLGASLSDADFPEVAETSMNIATALGVCGEVVTVFDVVRRSAAARRARVGGAQRVTDARTMTSQG